MKTSWGWNWLLGCTQCSTVQGLCHCGSSCLLVSTKIKIVRVVLQPKNGYIHVSGHRSAKTLFYSKPEQSVLKESIKKWSSGLEAQVWTQKALYQSSSTILVLFLFSLSLLPFIKQRQGFVPRRKLCKWQMKSALEAPQCYSTERRKKANQPTPKNT